MADVTIKYNGSTIAEMSETGSKTLKTSGKYCAGNFDVEYLPHAKVFTVTIPTAVAAKDVTLVTGDPDVAAHYADKHAMVTIRKITSNDANGTAIILHTNHQFPSAYGCYMNYNAGTGVNTAATMKEEVGGVGSAVDAGGIPFAKCTAAGDIIAHAQRLQNNFGGADYIITFTW